MIQSELPTVTRNASREENSANPRANSGSVTMPVPRAAAPAAADPRRAVTAPASSAGTRENAQCRTGMSAPTT